MPEIIPPKTTLDPNSVSDYAKSKGLVTEWNPQNASKLFEAQGLGSAQSYLSLGKNNSAANMALLAKLKGNTTTSNPGTISGNNSVQMGTATDKATGSALTSVTPGDKTDTTTKVDTGPITKPIKSSVVDPDTGNTTITYNDGTSEVKPVDPALAGSYAQAKKTRDDIAAQYTINTNALETQRKSKIAELTKAKENAMKAAKANYATNNPEGSGSDRDVYINEIAKKYDDTINQVTTEFDTQKAQADLNQKEALENVQGQLDSQIAGLPTLKLQQQQISSNILNTSIDNFSKVITGNPDVAKLFNNSGEITGSYDKVQAFIQTAKGMGVPEELVLPMLKSEVANSQAKQAAIDSKAASDELAQRRADIADRSAARADEMLTLALNRDRRADETAARTQVKAIEQDFLKTNTATQSLSTGQQYLARIEAASGEGVSALGLIDALVKLDTGGQAIRQGQTDILTESGTWGDSWQRLRAKMGISSKVGASTILTPNQVTQIKNQAKKIAKEQISAAIPAYVEAKQGVDSIKNDYPTEADKIDGYASQLKSAETYISKYGTDEDKKQAGVTGQSSKDASNQSSDEYVNNFLKNKK